MYDHACWKYSSRRCRRGFGIWWNRINSLTCAIWRWYLAVPEYNRWMIADTLPKILAYIREPTIITQMENICNDISFDYAVNYGSAAAANFAPGNNTPKHCDRDVLKFTASSSCTTQWGRCARANSKNNPHPRITACVVRNRMTGQVLSLKKLPIGTFNVCTNRCLRTQLAEYDHFPSFLLTESAENMNVRRYVERSRSPLNYGLRCWQRDFSAQTVSPAEKRKTW